MLAPISSRDQSIFDLKSLLFRSSKSCFYWYLFLRQIKDGFEREKRVFHNAF